MPESKLDKVKKIFGIGSAIAQPFLPKGAGTIVEMVNGALNGTGNSDAITLLATHVQTLETRVQTLEVEVQILRQK